MIPVTVLLDTLRHTTLLSPDRLGEAERLAAARPVKDAVAEMVARGWLTAYQGEELVAGRGFALVVGSYVLLSRLGAGGMGEVFKARHRVLGREVALKRILSGRLASSGAVERFLREAQATAMLSHPNVVQVIDAGEANDTHFLVMEYLPGVNLAEYLAGRGPLPAAEALDYIRQACIGMQHAHERGLVHRDLKPANLMRTEQKQIKVLDLGLALVAEAGTLTQTGAAFFGTVDYIAPEQVADSHKVDIRADIYSLGCTLYHLLAGKAPFEDAHPNARPSMHLTQEPPAIEQFRIDLPRRLPEVLRKMMAKKREERFATPGEAAAALGSFLVVKRKGGPPQPAAPAPKTQSPSAARPALPVPEVLSVLPLLEEASEGRRTPTRTPGRPTRDPDVLDEVVLADGTAPSARTEPPHPRKTLVPGRGPSETRSPSRTKPPAETNPPGERRTVLRRPPDEEDPRDEDDRDRREKETDRRSEGRREQMQVNPALLWVGLGCGSLVLFSAVLVAVVLAVRPAETKNESARAKEGPPPAAPQPRGYQSPQEVYDAYTAAYVRKDPRGVGDCLSPEARRGQAGVFAFGGLLVRQAAQRDQTGAAAKRVNTILAALDKHGLTAQATANITIPADPAGQLRVAESLVAFVRDPDALFLDLLAAMFQDVPGFTHGNGPLRDVRIEGDRATGTVSMIVNGVTQPPVSYHFIKGNDGWKMATPPSGS